jgi:hypothetical protein
MEQEPTYPVVVSSIDLPPWSGPPPYRSGQGPFHVLPMFRLQVLPGDWDGYLIPNIVVVGGRLGAVLVGQRLLSAFVKTISCIKITSSGLLTSNTATVFIDDDKQ